MKRLSTCTVADLLKHIKKTVTGDPKDWYVMIDEQSMNIELIDPVTSEIHAIEAATIYTEVDHGHNET